MAQPPLNLLIVTNIYAPSVNPRAFRWASIAEYWVAKGHVVDVVCAWERGLQKKEWRYGVRVHRVGGPIDQILRDKFSRRLRDKHVEGKDELIAGNSNSMPNRRNTVLSSVYRRANKALEKVVWPDHAWSWYFPAWRRAYDLLRRGGYNGLISVSFPFSGHMVGIRLKRKLPNLPWIVDIGDPFSFFQDKPINNIVLYERMNRYWEGKVLDKADAVTVTSEATEHEYLNRFPACSGKIRVIPPLISVPTGDGVEGGSESSNRTIRLVYAGTLYKAIRNPGYLLGLFSGLIQSDLGSHIELHFYGNINDCDDLFMTYKGLLGKKIFLHGKVEQRVVYRAMQGANLLVNIGNTTSYQLPSKVVEYASTGKPVLNIYKIRNDSSTEFFTSYGSCLNVMDDGKDIEGGVLEDIVRFIKTPPYLEPEKHRAFISRYMVNEVARGYEELFINRRG
jgi:glycosyltransferase involved in cell wall biosynthesis